MGAGHAQATEHTGHDVPTPGDGDDWTVLQRAVAGTMLVSFLLVMLAVAGEIIPPLLVAGVLFAAAAAVTWTRRRRAGTIAVGVVATLWLVSTIVRAGMVVGDLVDLSTPWAFVATWMMVVGAVTGTFGLVGTLRRASPTRATRALGAAGVALLAVILTGTIGGVVSGDAPPTVVTTDEATVTLRDLEFAPSNLQVPVGATVTWQWDDGEVEHDVVADRFSSDLKAEGTFTHTFADPGTYTYECTVHPGMDGTVTVVTATEDGPSGDA